MFVNFIRSGDKKTLDTIFEQREKEKQRAEAEQAEARRPVDWNEYKKALDTGKAIDIARLKIETCPEDTRDLYAEIQRGEKQRRGY